MGKSKLQEGVAFVSTTRRSLLVQAGKVLKGECNRCGKCCQMAQVPFPNDNKTQCVYLEWETFNRKPKAICSIHTRKPMGCALWPETDDSIPEECGFYWEKLDEKTINNIKRELEG